MGGVVHTPDDAFAPRRVHDAARDSSLRVGEARREEGARVRIPLFREAPRLFQRGFVDRLPLLRFDALPPCHRLRIAEGRDSARVVLIDFVDSLFKLKSEIFPSFDLGDLRERHPVSLLEGANARRLRIASAPCVDRRAERIRRDGALRRFKLGEAQFDFIPPFRERDIVRRVQLARPPVRRDSAERRIVGVESQSDRILKAFLSVGVENALSDDSVRVD